MSLSPIQSVDINGSCLVFNDDFSNTVKDYYEYITMLLYKILEKNPELHIIAIFENLRLDVNPMDRRKIIYIYLNIEHTLVRVGGKELFYQAGRYLEYPKKGNIQVVGVGEEKRENYLVRIDKYPLLKQKDIVIEYSNPNITNIRESGLFEDFVEKIVYISPLIYEPQFECVANKTKRTIDCLTTFTNTNEHRRKALLERAGSQIINVNNCFNRNDLRELYCKTKVMINIHQTDHHHTFEELRVLPALCCGIIVVCERSPLIEKIPYHEFVIWADYGEVLEKSQEVLENYEECYNFIFGGDRLRNLIKKMENDNYDRLLTKLKQCSL